VMLSQPVAVISCVLCSARQRNRIGQGIRRGLAFWHG